MKYCLFARRKCEKAGRIIYTCADDSDSYAMKQCVEYAEKNCDKRDYDVVTVCHMDGIIAKRIIDYPYVNL